MEDLQQQMRKEMIEQQRSRSRGLERAIADYGAEIAKLRCKDHPDTVFEYNIFKRDRFILERASLDQLFPELRTPEISAEEYDAWQMVHFSYRSREDIQPNPGESRAPLNTTTSMSLQYQPSRMEEILRDALGVCGAIRAAEDQLVYDVYDLHTRQRNWEHINHSTEVLVGLRKVLTDLCEQFGMYKLQLEYQENYNPQEALRGEAA